MKKDTIIKIISQIRKEFYDVDFLEGDCLNLAIAMHDFLVNNGMDSNVVPIMRHSEEDFTHVIFSHAVIVPHYVHKPFDLSDSVDIEGDNAYERWISQFNTNLVKAGRQQVRFWCNKPPTDLAHFAQQSEQSFGNKSMNLLVDKPELRSKIIKFAEKELATF